MYSDFVLIDRDGDAQRAERLAFGDTAGRSEAWLRDLLLAQPGLLPVAEIDPSFGPLIPLCSELRTEAGLIDCAFVSPHGRLTLVECKLWRNPEARRKVVAQILDYARVLSRWSYSDLQRQVSARLKRHGNVPFELVQAHAPDLTEQRFVDQVTQALRNGRFLLLIAGDGIREDVSAISELVNRNSAMGFSFALLEVALYGMPDGALLVQPRVVARTKLIERTVVYVRDGIASTVVDEAAFPESGTQGAGTVDESGEGARQAAYRRWWQPVLDAPLDDPDQEPIKLFWPNNVRAQLPIKGTWVLGYATGNGPIALGVTTAGRTGYYEDLEHLIAPIRDELLAELPAGTQWRQDERGGAFYCGRKASSFSSPEEMKAWVADTMNGFINVLRPRIKRAQAS